MLDSEALIIPEAWHGERLDKALAQLLPQYSRANVQQFLKQGQILIDGAVLAGKSTVKGGEVVDLSIETESVQTDWCGEAIELDVVFEDAHLLVINKSIDMVVHPAVGNWSGTLVNGLLHRIPELNQLPRAGIVHRLDKDTSGLLVVAKTLTTYHALVQQLQAREVKRQYCALVYGEVVGGGTINAPLGRSRHDRQKIAVVHQGKDAITHYRVRKRFSAFTLLKVLLETGRTHQIRVHLASIHHPIVGDASYGHGLRLPKAASDELKNGLKQFQHQALHAERLAFIHPATQVPVLFKAPLPEDFLHLLTLLRDADAESAWDEDEDGWGSED